VYDAAGQLAAEYGPPTDAGTKYLTSDHLGSTRLITDTGGLPARCYDYLPFGEEIANGTAGRTANCFGSAVYPGSPDIENVKFTGKERDAETGLDFFGERYFSSAQGRFTSPDSMIMKKEWFADPQRWNHYAYVRNNPLRYVDPNGEDLTIVYSYGPDASDEQKKWFEANKAKIFAAIQRKFNDAGVKNVTFKDAASLSKDDLKKLADSPVGGDIRKTGVSGVARLEVAGQESSVFKGYAPLGTYGATYHGLSDVFMDRGGNGSPSCDAVCGFANIASHEIGHGLGFDDPGHNFMNYLGFAPTVPNEWFRDNVMKQGGDPYAKPLPFRGDKNQRAIDEVNRAKPFPQ
jgi:RHS repeat-associated protein